MSKHCVHENWSMHDSDKIISESCCWCGLRTSRYEYYPKPMQLPLDSEHGPHQERVTYYNKTMCSIIGECPARNE